MDYAQIYRDHADDYDALVTAEDAEGQLGAALRPLLPHRGTLVDIGTGTGRISRIFTSRAAKIVGVERAPAMLEIARGHAHRSGHPDWTLVEADARQLPLPDQSADLVVAGWVFGHFRSWMPDTWKADVDQAIAEMRRVAKPTAAIVIIETLGTMQETPRVNEALDEYYAHLETTYGMTRHVLRTDYRFADVPTAVRLMGLFFGDSMVRQINARGVPEVPECTGMWSLRPPKIESDKADKPESSEKLAATIKPD